MYREERDRAICAIEERIRSERTQYNPSETNLPKWTQYLSLTNCAPKTSGCAKSIGGAGAHIVKPDRDWFVMPAERWYARHLPGGF